LEEPRFADTLEMKASQSFSSDLPDSEREGERGKEREQATVSFGLGGKPPAMRDRERVSTHSLPVEL